MKVRWYLTPKVPQSAYPQLASYRYRCAIPMSGLRKLGIDCEALDDTSGDVVVFAKHWDSEEPRLALEARARGSRVVFDVCDDHFWGRYDAHYRTMVEISQVVTCSTKAMAERVFEQTGRSGVVVTDPYEYPQREAVLSVGKNLLWFGLHRNLRSLERELPKLEDFDVMAVSNKKPDFPVRFQPWSCNSMPEAFAWADAVIIPTDKKTASPNRMVEAIRNGLFVIAHDIPSYRHYGMYLGDIRDGVKWFLRNREEALERVKKAQVMVEAMHSPVTVAGKWLEAFSRES